MHVVCIHHVQYITAESPWATLVGTSQTLVSSALLTFPDGPHNSHSLGGPGLGSHPALGLLLASPAPMHAGGIPERHGTPAGWPASRGRPSGWLPCGPSRGKGAPHRGAPQLVRGTPCDTGCPRLSCTGQEAQLAGAQGTQGSWTGQEGGAASSIHACMHTGGGACVQHKDVRWGQWPVWRPPQHPIHLAEAQGRHTCMHGGRHTCMHARQAHVHACEAGRHTCMHARHAHCSGRSGAALL